MTLKNIADALGITAYPEILDRLTADPSIPDASVINLPLIHSLQKEYDLFGDYYDAVLQGAEDLERDSLRRSWGDAVCRCLPYLSYTERRAVPIPATDKTPAGDMLPLLMLIPLVPSSVEAYRSHGFSEEEIRQLLASYAGAIRTVHNRTGRPGYDKTYYNWMKLYANTRIFLFGGFNFEIKTMPDNVLVLQNRESGALMPLLHQNKIHKSGLILGSAGCKDSDGAFDIAVREDENAYRG
ncbi:MAG: hypothetical protein E7662_13195, partial [Ruminococcaceae bacterium]|nr:hypothetical protein [Oscillospiraceae bacterium]